MNTKSLILPILLVMPLSAQDWELGVFVGQQTYKSANWTVVSGGNTVYHYGLEPQNKSVFGARLGYSIVDIGPTLLQLNVGFQPETKTSFKASGDTVGVSGAPQFADYRTSHSALGVMFNFKTLFALGFGVEYRFEKIKSMTTDGHSIYDASTTYNRPWARFNARYAFPAPVIKPFFGVEIAAPLTTSSDLGSDATSLKSLAPKFQFGLYGGLRF